MYSWIWRKIPFGLPGKLIGSTVLILGTGALLWFVAFPQLSSMMTPTQSTIEDDGGGGGNGGGDNRDDNDSDRVTDNPSGYDLESSPTDDKSSS